MQMDGKVVMITGASRGIGEAAARAFAKAGAMVALLARSDDRIAEIAGDIGEAAIAIPCDVSRFWEVDAAVQACVTEFGGLDVLIGNAGVIEPISHLITADPDEWAKVIDINLKGVMYGMRAAVPAMIERGGGTVITISSGAANGPVEAWSHYCASKAAAKMLTACLNKENAGDGIRALGLSPGTVATQMQREIKASGVNPVSQLEWEDHIPPEWVAQCMLWMCGPGADAYLGSDVSLRDEDVRRAVGLMS